MDQIIFKFILNALNFGYDVEIDIWHYKNELYLGHDEPTILLPEELLEHKDKLWFHAKNLDPLLDLHQLNVHYFWHQNDDVTITNKGFRDIVKLLIFFFLIRVGFFKNKKM